MNKILSTKNAPAAIGPYSQGIVVNGLLYTSGQIPLNAAGEFVEGEIDVQTEQVIDDLAAILAAAGATLADVVKTTVFVTDLNDFARLNEIYGQRFGEHRPARSTVQVARLPRGAKVEIEAVVKLPG